MKIKVSEATEIQIDWLVAKCLGYTCYEHDPIDGKVFRKTPEGFTADLRIEDNSFCYDWAQGGPIIEREKVGTWPAERIDKEGLWGARMLNTYINYGPTPLIAAMRCYVVSKLGEEVEVPSELLS